jgi:hypothetical protein
VISDEMFKNSKVIAIFGPKIIEVRREGFRDCKEISELDLPAL